ncbi:hypothetical protein BJ996_007645 [Streptomyces phaeogriseichromatogenes]|nr:hypothetical protein [Streptomyces murinus]
MHNDPIVIAAAIKAAGEIVAETKNSYAGPDDGTRVGRIARAILVELNK